MTRELPTDLAAIERILDVIEEDILPITTAGVRAGNKIFGAAVITKSDRTLVLAGTNNEIENPLWHAEVYVLERFYQLAAEARPDPKDCLFISTHEPCSLCLSAITWAGFDNFYYLFSYEDSRDLFDISHDIRILEEVFALEAGAYRADNAYWTAHAIARLAAAQAEDESRRLRARIESLIGTYKALSRQYRRSRKHSNIPLA